MDYRSEFAQFDDVIFLNLAEQSPLPLAAARAAKLAVERKTLPHQMAHDTYASLPEHVRSLLAQLLGADADDVAITTGASAGISAVAAGMDWKPGDEILVGEGEFPAHFAAWLDWQKAGLVQLKVVRPRERFISVEDYARALTPRTRLVSASLVRFDNGLRLEAAHLAHTCHQAGAALLLDASQCAGAMAMNLAQLGADFVTSAGYKWLLGPYGTGFFWMAPGWAERLRLRPTYWMAVEGAHKFDHLATENLHPVPGVRRWDTPETASFFNLAAWEASLEFILSAGVENVAAHNAALIAQLIESLPRDRCVLVSPAEHERRGPFVCIAARSAEATQSLYERLRAAKVFVASRQGALRVAPYLYNTSRDISRLVSLLTE